MQKIDGILNNFTTYKVVLYGLRILAGITVSFSILGLLPYHPLNLVLSLCILTVTCYLSNIIFARIFKISANVESYAITLLILFFILTPAGSINSVIFTIITGIIAIGSKYLLVINKRHIFNPAAFGLVVMGIMGSPYAEWWVGNTYLFPFVFVIGFLIVRKVRKFQLFSSYVLFALLTISIFAFKNGLDVPSTIFQAVTSWPFLFLGTVMLTEPLTMPPSRNKQLIYGAIVGALSGAQFNIGPIFSTSETALILGNIFSYFVSFRKRLILEFREKIQISPTIHEFIFSAPKSLAYLPGQYFEWTLGHRRPDSRGVRRFFTIASSPTEDNFRLGVRIDSGKGSSFKKALLNLTPGQKLYAGSLAGDFTLHKDRSEKLVFIAGGIGITPFRSIAKFITDKKEKRDIVLFYSDSEPESFVYKDIFKFAEKFGFRTVYVQTKTEGRLTVDTIKKEVPDFTQRTFYISGSNRMVETYKKLLRELGIKPHRIVTDYFPGF